MSVRLFLRLSERVVHCDGWRKWSVGDRKRESIGESQDKGTDKCMGLCRDNMKDQALVDPLLSQRIDTVAVRMTVRSGLAKAREG